ncbi:MAG: serine hydrolase [Pseudomonadota bacterium]
MLRSLMACMLASSAVFAAAQEGGTSPEMDAALAAGWKAGFICSASFNAGQPLEEIEANELDGIYPDFRKAYDVLPDAEIDQDAKTVSVAFSGALPPRMAAWRPGVGCTQLPIGAEAEMVDVLPRLPEGMEIPVPQPETSPILSPDVPPIIPNRTFKSLVETVAAAFDGETFGAGSRTSGVLVARNGVIIAEQYDRGIDAETPQRTWSVAKSFSASIIGVAVQKGFVNVSAPTGLEAWSAPGDPRGNITLGNLLSMASGLDSGQRGNRTDRTYFGGAKIVDDALGHSLEAAPGTRYKYANNDTLLAMRTLREAMDNDQAYHVMPYMELLWKIGATRTFLEMDWGGDLLSSSLVWTTARDMARLGQLHLQNGEWNGERILPDGWAGYVSAPAPVQPRRANGYGAQWWLLNKTEGIPEDAYGAFGNRGQYLIVIPSLDLLVVRRGYDVNGGGRFDPNGFATAVVAALKADDEAYADAAPTSLLPEAPKQDEEQEFRSPRFLEPPKEDGDGN